VLVCGVWANSINLEMMSKLQNDEIAEITPSPSELGHNVKEDPEANL